MSSLTMQQRTALLRPCFEPEETTDRRFSFMHPLRLYSPTLTLNVGME
jgi:hypothetical protein